MNLIFLLFHPGNRLNLLGNNLLLVGFIHRNILNNRHVPVCYGESTRNIIEHTTSGAKANLMMTITQYVYR